jgi:hypothetical protein
MPKEAAVGSRNSVGSCGLRSQWARTPVRFLTVFCAAFLAVVGCANFAAAEIVTEWELVSGVSGTSSVYVGTTSYTLDAINASGGIVIGDKLFDSFTMTTLAASSGALIPATSAVSLTPVQINGNYGFKVNGGWLATAGAYLDATFQYHASVLDGYVARGYAISGNTLKMTAFGGKGVVSITENCYVGYPGVPDDAEHYYLGGGDVEYTYNGTTDAYDAINFPSVATDVWFTKDILVWGTSGVTQLSEFYQVLVQVPEPSTFVLMFIAGLGIFVFRKFHN